jgi:hypothetical protein
MMERYQEIQSDEQQSAEIVKRHRIKATFYLYPEDIVAIDQMQTERFRKLGKKPERSHIVSEAIQYLFSQQNS